MTDARKCDFCTSKATYLYDFRGKELIKIAGCKEHKLLAMNRQESESLNESFRQRMENFGNNTYGIIK